MILGLRPHQLFVGTWLAILGCVACSERVPTTPTGPATQSPASCTYDISPTNRIHGPGAENGTVSVTAPAGCAWTASSGVSWITVTAGSSGTGNGAVGYAVAPNSGAGRTGTLTVAGRTFAIEQATPACPLDDNANFSKWIRLSGNTGTVTASGQQVEIRAVTGQGAAGIISPCPLEGDFDVQVGYTLINWPAANPYALRFITRPHSFQINRTGAGNYLAYLGPTLLARLTTNDSAGQLRLARTGTSIAGFYSSGSGWSRLSSTDIGIERMQFIVDLSSATPSTPSEIVVRFDNFRINVGTPAN